MLPRRKRGGDGGRVACTVTAWTIGSKVSRLPTKTRRRLAGPQRHWSPAALRRASRLRTRRPLPRPRSTSGTRQPACLHRVVHAPTSGEVARLDMPVRGFVPVKRQVSPKFAKQGRFRGARRHGDGPMAFANCSANKATPPVPMVRTVSPARTGRGRAGALQAVTPARGRVAPSS